MGRMDIVLTDDLEKEFRSAVADRLGFKKGNISVAVQDAIKDWLKKSDFKLV